MFTRNTLIAALLVIAVNVAPAQNYLSGTRLRLVDGLPTQVYGGILIPPTPLLADVVFTFPGVGGNLLVDDGSGKVGWLVGGNPLLATGLLGSVTAQDVSFIAGGTDNVRMRLEDDAKAVSLPDQTALRLMEPTISGTNYTAISAQAQIGNITYTLPGTIGTPGQILAIADVPPPTATSATLIWKSPSSSGNSGLGFLPVGDIPDQCTDYFSFYAATPGTYMIKSHIKFQADDHDTHEDEHIHICWDLPTASTISYKWLSLHDEEDDHQHGSSSTKNSTDIHVGTEMEEFSITGTIIVIAPGNIKFQLGKSDGNWHTLAGSYMLIFKL